MSEKECSNCYSQLKVNNDGICPICGHYEIIDSRPQLDTNETTWLEM